MSHPYSGAASYIYANEYRTPIQTDFGIKPLPPLPPPTTKSYNYHHPQQPVEINLHVRPDASDIGYGPTRAGMLEPTVLPTSFSFSPSSQAPSLPTSHSTHTHSRSHSGNQHHSHSRGGSGAHQYHHRQYQNDTRTYTHTPTPPPHPYSSTTTSTVLNSNNDPFAYHPQRYHRDHDQLIPPPLTFPHSYLIPEKKKRSRPKLKLKLKPKFKLTLPNPFHFLRSTFSSPSHKQKSPRSVWSPSLTGPISSRRFHLTSRPAHQQSTIHSPPPALPPSNHNDISTFNTPYSSGAYYYANMFDNSSLATDSRGYPAPTTTTTTTTVFNDADYTDDDPSSSGWRWSNPMSPSSKSSLSRWLSLNGTIKTKSSSGTLQSKSSISTKAKQHHKIQMLAKSNSRSKSKSSHPPTNVNANMLPTVAEHNGGDGYHNSGRTLPRRTPTATIATTGVTGTTTGISRPLAVPAEARNGSVVVLDQGKANRLNLDLDHTAKGNENENENITNNSDNQPIPSQPEPVQELNNISNSSAGTQTPASTSTSVGSSTATSTSATSGSRNRSLKFGAREEVGTMMNGGGGRRTGKERKRDSAAVSG